MNVEQSQAYFKAESIGLKYFVTITINSDNIQLLGRLFSKLEEEIEKGNDLEFRLEQKTFQILGAHFKVNSTYERESFLIKADSKNETSQESSGFLELSVGTSSEGTKGQDIIHGLLGFFQSEVKNPNEILTNFESDPSSKNQLSQDNNRLTLQI